MTLYIGNDEVSKKIILENISGGGIDLPEISEVTKGKILGNDGSILNWVDESDYISSKFNETLNMSYITNCITKIPQDIKLELSDGKMTLKAGSKLYKPDSTFVTINSDKIRTATYADAIAFYDIDNDVFSWCQKTECYSQDTTPTYTQYMLWYDTANNTVKVTNDTGATWSECTLPICEFTADSTKITSIDQVFDGFGYIGSTIFALPGVEGLIPNGRNIDGSLNNTKFTTTRVLTRTYGSNETYRDADLMISSSHFTTNYVKYYNDKNLIIDSLGREFSYVSCGIASFVNGRITSFNPKNVFQSVDRNDTEWASTQGKPSDRYIDLTLQASGANYTAPANGWFYTKYTKNSETATQSMILGFSSEDIDGFGNFITMGMNSLVTNTFYRINQPIKAGKKMRFSYQKANANDTIVLGFCYDEGAK